MQIVAVFDPSVAASGSFTVPQSAGVGKMVIYNESSVCLLLKFQNGYSDYLPAWLGMIYTGNYGGTVVQWSQQAVLSSSGAPLSMVLVETYGANECVLNMFPAMLARQANVGNTVTTTVVGVSTLQNDGNAANTQFVEATVLGDSASAVNLTNNGVFKLGTAANPGSVSFDNGGITSNGAGVLTAAQISASTPLGSLGDLPGAAGITTRFGSGLHGTTDVGVESATFLVLAGEQGALFKQNNYFDGTNHRFMSAAPAYQFDLGGAVSFLSGAIAVRSSTNASPATGAIITWSSWTNIALTVGLGSGTQTVTNGSTLTITNQGNQLTASGNVTGLLMPMGTFTGQTVVFFNKSAFSMTFASHTTSNVINGTGVTINAFKTQILIWNPFDGNQWYPV